MIPRGLLLPWLPFLVACASAENVSVGRNDPLPGAAASDPARASRSPNEWIVPTTVCDSTACTIGPECSVIIGDCVAHYGIADLRTCKRPPPVCGDDVAHVCGCDRATYANACEAARAGAGIAFLTACP
jgi:hypothetical protein